MFTHSEKLKKQTFGIFLSIDSVAKKILMSCSAAGLPDGIFSNQKSQLG
jgi:hypothetical protein